MKIKNNVLIWLIFAAAFLITYASLSDFNIRSKKISFSDFLQQVENGSIKEVKIQGSSIESIDNRGNQYSTMIPYYYPKIIDTLINKDIKIDVVPTEGALQNIFSMILSWFPVLLLVGVWIYFMKNMQGGGKAMNFGKSKARLVSDSKKVTFNDVAGIEEARDELEELVAFLKEPMKFQRLGGKIPRGCLLVGSPGTGKTLLAKAIAGEAGVPFFSISGSDFVEMFVGVGASRVRDMFKQAKEKAPCILFIDEIDAVGRHRGVGFGGGNDEREQTLNQLLVEMDGFAENEGTIVIAATNRPDVLDPALLRPGRFDRQIVVPLPDINGRERILEVHLKNKPLADDVNIKTIARGTPGFTGADLANLVNEASLLSARINNKNVNMSALEEAKDKVLMGPERRSILMSQDQQELTAYHEGGHAIVTLHIPASDPIHKATIIPRGKALGMVMRLPEDDRYSVTREKLKGDIAVAMGGRVAEEMVFGYDKVTTGASSDIKMATQLARKMVSQWGLSDDIGHVQVWAEGEDQYSQVSRDSHISGKLMERVDAEVSKLVEEGYQTAKTILKKHREQLNTLANALLEHETLEANEILKVLGMEDRISKNQEPAAKKAPRKSRKSQRRSVPSCSEEVLDNSNKEVKSDDDD